MTDAQIEHMTQRFLGWRLPEDFNPDGGVSFSPIMNQSTGLPYEGMPTGTNLLDYMQAKAMVLHMVEGLELGALNLPANAREIICRALCTSNGFDPNSPYEDRCRWNFFESRADAIIAALTEAP